MLIRQRSIVFSKNNLKFVRSPSASVVRHSSNDTNTTSKPKEKIVSTSMNRSAMPVHIAAPVHLPKFLRDTLEGKDPNKASVPVMEFCASNGFFEEKLMEKSELVSITGVAPRDLRKVMSLSTRRLISGIGVRKDCIIIHMEHIKAIIMKDRAFLFDLQEPKVTVFSSFFPFVMRQLAATKTPIFFEFRVLEQVLIEVTETLDSELKELSPRMTDLLSELSSVQSAKNLSAMVVAVDELSAFENRVLSVKNAILELLNNDEDLAGLFLTEKRATADHIEAETLMENYFMQIEETTERIAVLKQRFHNMTNYVQIHFDSQRNRLMRMNLVISMGALSTACTAAGASLFGMNLTSGLESHPQAFVLASTSLVGMGAMMFSGSLWYYRQTKQMDLKKTVPQQAPPPPQNFVQ